MLVSSDCFVLFCDRSLGVAGFGRALKSGAPHCTHGCTDSCWEFLPNEPLPGPPSFVANTTRDQESVDSDHIAYRYGVDTPICPDVSSDSLHGLFFVCFLPTFPLPSVMLSFLTLIYFPFSEHEGSMPFALVVSATSSGDSDYMSDGVNPVSNSSGPNASSGSGIPFFLLVLVFVLCPPLIPLLFS